MIQRILKFVGTSLLLVSPVAAQFGVGGGRKPKTFEELNEQAKAQKDAAGTKKPGPVDLKAWQNEMMADPRVQKEMEEMLTKMTPEQLEKQMQDAINMIASGDIIKTLMDQSDGILDILGETGAVDPEELEKLKADPKYFEAKMQESFDQMKGLFDDPDIMKAAAETMSGMTELLKNPGLLDDMMQGLLSDFDDDEKIEEARLKLLSDPDAMAHPMLKEMFESEEMQEILKDPVKWKESVQEGKGLLGDAKGAAAGIGEL